MNKPPSAPGELPGLEAGTLKAPSSTSSGGPVRPRQPQASSPSAIIYCLPGTTGWPNFAQATGLATLWWNPTAQTSDACFGLRSNRFGFNIAGTSGITVVVEATTNLAGPWYPLGTNTLTGGAGYFSDPQWTNYPARLYRLRSP